MKRKDFEENLKKYGLQFALASLDEANANYLGEAMGFNFHEDFFGHHERWHVNSYDIDYLRQLVGAGAVLDVDCGGFIGHNYIHDIDSENFKELEEFMTAYISASKEDKKDVYGEIYIAIQVFPVFDVGWLEWLRE
jgi:hypothetical protein